MASIDSINSARTSSAGFGLTTPFNNAAGGHMLAWIWNIGSTGPGDPTSVTFNGVALSKLGTSVSDAEASFHLYRLDAPETGTHDFVVSYGAEKAEIAALIVTLSNADVSTPYGTPVSGQAGSGAPSIAVGSVVGDLVIDGVCGYDISGWTPVEGQSEAHESTSSFTAMACSTKTATGASTTMSWTQSPSDGWFQIGVAVKDGGGPPPVGIDSVTPDAFVDGETGVVIAGENFGASPGRVVISPVDDIDGQPTTPTPSIASFSTALADASGNFTAPTPADVQENDILVVIASMRGTAVVSPPAGAGWQEIAQENTGNTSTTGSSSIASGGAWWVRRGGSAPSMAFTRTGGDVALVRTLAIRGCVTSGSPFSGTPTIATLGANSQFAATGAIVTDQDNCLLVYALCAALDTTVSNYTATSPSTLSEVFDSLTTSGADTALAVASATKATAGSTGTIQGQAGDSSRHVGIAMAFKPPIPAGAAVEQTDTAWGDTSVTFTAVQGSLPLGEHFLFVEDEDGLSNVSGFPVTFEAPPGGFQSAWSKGSNVVIGAVR